MADRKPFHEQVAERVIQLLQEGTAPWQVPWDERGHGRMPRNAATDRAYRGVNAVWLLSQGRSDPRWLTYRQAQELGGQVRRGERSTAIQYWKFDEERVQKDAQGNVVRNAQGDAVKVRVRLARPRTFHAAVFNGEQIDGLPPPTEVAHSWDPVTRAEQILEASGASIVHTSSHRAFYRLSSDTIHLPAKEQFPSAARYYATALHELGHWTGGPTRLDRDLGHPFGSEGYAREELRAEIASMMLGDALAVGHDPGQHAAYVGSWIKLLENDPLEIFRASADATKIQDYVLGFSQQLVRTTALSSEVGIASEDNKHRGAVASSTTSPRESEVVTGVERRYLAVPYAERTAASAVGARWDRQARAWFMPPGADLSQVQRWLPEEQLATETPALDPREEFSRALREAGAHVEGPHPMMDGRRHRIAVEGDRGRQTSGSYVAYLDGAVPAGHISNFRTGYDETWKAKGYHLGEAERATLRAQTAERLQEREAEQQRTYQAAAQRVRGRLERLQPLERPTPYLLAKGVAVHGGVFTDGRGRTYIPAMDFDGVWTMQTIGSDGRSKRFAAGGRKAGCFHVVGGLPGLAGAPALVVAEGYATAATLRELLDQPVVAAFDAGNLAHVAKTLHARYPEKPVVVAGDDDLGNALNPKIGINTGKVKAEDAARVVGGTVLLPVFAAGEQRANPKAFSDFNDLATKSVVGRAGAMRQVRAGLAAALAAHARSAAVQEHQQHQHHTGRGHVGRRR